MLRRGMCVGVALSLGCTGTALAVPQQAGPEAASRLVLKATFLKSPAAYFEGALQYVEVHRPGNRVLVLRRRYAGRFS